MWDTGAASCAEAVLLGKVFAWLQKEIDLHLREKWAPNPVNTEAVREFNPARNRGRPKRMDVFTVGVHSKEAETLRGWRTANYPSMLGGAGRLPVRCAIIGA